MAIIKCPECGKEISDKAHTCPNCGFPVSENLGNDDAIEEVMQETVADSVPETYETYTGACATDGDAAVAEKESKINDVFIWLLSGVLILYICMVFFKAPSYLFFVSLILNPLFVLLDDRKLEKSEENVKTIWFVLGMILVVPIYVIARTIKTKRIIAGAVYLVLAAILAVYSVAFNSTSKELVKYVNTDMKQLAINETKMLNSYNSVIGANYTDDLTFYSEIKNVSLPAADDLLSDANKIYRRLSSKEIKEVHSIYVDFCTTYREGFENIIEGMAIQDNSLIQKGAKKLLKTERLSSDYLNALENLCDKYGIEIKFNR